MTEELYFNTELRNCLDAAGFSDCGENDQWNWWYQRLHQAHDASVDGVTDVQRIENAKLREFAQAMAEVAYEGQMLCDKCRFFHGCYNGGKKEHEGRGCQWLLWARKLGIEVEDDRR